MKHKKGIITLVCSFFWSLLPAQTELILGYNVGRYTYMESPPHNYSAQFNNGWDLTMVEAGQVIYFQSSTDQYSIKNTMNYDRWNRGFKLGFRTPLNDDRTSLSIYFLGATNASGGERTNLSTNVTETFRVKSKFGGIYMDFTYNPHERIGLSAIMGFERYKLGYSYENDSTNRKMAPMGWNLHFLSGKMTPKSKAMNCSVGLGLTILLWKNESVKLEYVSSYRWVFNDLSEVYRGLYYNTYLFNLNSWNNTLQIVYAL